MVKLEFCRIWWFNALSSTAMEIIYSTDSVVSEKFWKMYRPARYWEKHMTNCESVKVWGWHMEWVLMALPCLYFVNFHLRWNHLWSLFVLHAVSEAAADTNTLRELYSKQPFVPAFGRRDSWKGNEGGPEREGLGLNGSWVQWLQLSDVVCRLPPDTGTPLSAPWHDFSLWLSGKSACFSDSISQKPLGQQKLDMCWLSAVQMIIEGDPVA